MNRSFSPLLRSSLAVALLSPSFYAARAAAQVVNAEVSVAPAVSAAVGAAPLPALSLGAMPLQALSSPIVAAPAAAAPSAAAPSAPASARAALTGVFSDPKSAAAPASVETRIDALFTGAAGRHRGADPVVAGASSRLTGATLVKPSARAKAKSARAAQDSLSASLNAMSRSLKIAQINQTRAAVIMMIAGAIASTPIGLHGIAIAAGATVALFVPLFIVDDMSSKHQSMNNLISNFRDALIFLTGSVGSFALGAGAFAAIAAIGKLFK